MSSLPDLSPFFAAYEVLAAEADAVFSRVAQQYPDCVACQTGCDDCCHALFDLSLIEALYLNQRFVRAFDFGPERSRILFLAAETDRHITRVKKSYFKTLRQVDDENAVQGAVADVMTQAARERAPCPLLTSEKTCVLYDYRPITCRLYGIPSAIGGKGHVCGLSRFDKGRNYPTVFLEKIQDRLDALSLDLQKGIGSRYTELHKVYVPLSMALLTSYDNTYLGVGPAASGPGNPLKESS